MQAGPVVDADCFEDAEEEFMSARSAFSRQSSISSAYGADGMRVAVVERHPKVALTAPLTAPISLPSPFPAAHGVVAISSTHPAITAAVTTPSKPMSAPPTSSGQQVPALQHNTLDVMIGDDEPDVMPQALPSEWRPEHRVHKSREDLIEAQRRNEALWVAKQHDEAENRALRLETASSGEKLRLKKSSGFGACFGLCG